MGYIYICIMVEYGRQVSRYVNTELVHGLLSYFAGNNRWKVDSLKRSSHVAHQIELFNLSETIWA